MAAKGKYKDRKMTITPEKEDGGRTFLGTCEDHITLYFPLRFRTIASILLFVELRNMEVTIDM